MSAITKQTIQMIEMLPESELKTVNELLKIIVRAWDPDFTKATSEEKEKMKIAEKEFKEGIYFTDEDVWN